MMLPTHLIRPTKPMQTDATAGFTRLWPLRCPRAWLRPMVSQGGAADRQLVRAA